MGFITQFTGIFLGKFVPSNACRIFIRKHMEQTGMLSTQSCQDLNIRLYTIDEKRSSFLYNWHKDLEIMLVETGKLTVQTEDETYELRHNDFLIINMDSPHAIRSRHPFKALILKFPQEQLKKLIPEIDKLKFCVSNNKEIKHQILDKLEKLEYYAKHGDETESLILFKICLYELIYICYKECTIFLKKSQTNHIIDDRVRLQGAIEYISKNYTGKISIDTLASISGLTNNYFCRLFKKSFGITALEYIYDLRFCKISKELINTDLPISIIMKNSGFTNWKLFAKLFKERFYVTAGAFRKQYRK